MNIYLREKHWSVVSHMCPDQELNLNPYLSVFRESNPQPFGLQDNAPTNWATLSRAQHVPFIISFACMYARGAEFKLTLPSIDIFIYFYCIISITIYLLYIPQSPYWCPRPWVLFPFCLIPPPANTHPPRSVSLISIYESVSILLVSSFSWFLRFHRWIKSYSICLFLTGLFHLA